MLPSRPTLASGSTRGSSVDGSFVGWPRSEFGKFCETCGCSADVRLAPGRGLSGSVVVARAVSDVCDGQKPSRFLVIFLHLLFAAVMPLQREGWIPISIRRVREV